MSVDPNTFLLKHTNVSRPRLSHSESQQSVAASLTASEGYYSATDKASNTGDDHDSDSDDRAPQDHDHLPSQANAPIATSLRGIGIPRQHQHQHQHQHQNDNAIDIDIDIDSDIDNHNHNHPRWPSQDMPPSHRHPVAGTDSQATTPGHDTTPYIRFAIDQLTRDEEVRGSRVYPQVTPANDNQDYDYPVEPIAADDGPRHRARENETQQRTSEYASPKPRRKSSPRNAPAHQPAPPQAYAPAPIYTSTEIYDPPRSQSQSPPQPNVSRAPTDVFVALDQTTSRLQFRPAILRSSWLGFFLLLCTLVLAALIFSALYSNRNQGSGLWDYVSFGDGRYFVFEYLPAIVGMVILLWLIQVQTAFQRTIPFISMATGSTHQRSESAFLQLYPTQFLLPNLEHFRAGYPLVGVCHVIFWLFTWTIPLLAACFNVRYNEERRVWTWVAVQGVIWTVIVLYILLILALVYLTLFLLRKETGLRWDPRSLADILSLFERSNTTADYQGSETFQESDWDQLRHRADRIGYWSTTNHPSDIFYGIGREGGLTKKFTLEEGRIKEKTSKPAHSIDRPTNRVDFRDPEVRLKYLPWYLKDTTIIAYIVTAVVLLITFLIVSFIRQNVRVGFLPQVQARTNAAGFSASNFLYSFIPALIGHFLFLAILSLDYSLRVLQPYIALSSSGGATAETSLLVDYVCRLPFSVTLAAAENKHFQTAILSLVSTTSISIPIIAGGCFWTQYYSNEDNVRVAADLPGYYALCFFLVFYTLGLFALVPNRRRAALPHRSNTVAEITSWVYQSPILADRAFARPETKPELVARLMGATYRDNTWTRSFASLVRPSRNDLRGDSPTDPALHADKGRGAAHGEGEVEVSAKTRYGFGIHVGRDGLEHLGIDRVHRGGDTTGRQLVIWEEQRKHKRKSWTEHVL